MSAQESQVVDSNELIPLTDYEFSGDSATVANKCRIVEGYRLKATIYHAAIYAQVHRATVYKYMESDPEFAQAMTDSFEDASDVLETSVYERALGRDEHKPDSLLAMFWLKAHRPKFRDRVAIDLEVVKDEIQQRMAQLDLKQLPPAMMTQFIPASGLSESMQFRDQCEQIQKEVDSDSSSSTESSSSSSE